MLGAARSPGPHATAVVELIGRSFQATNGHRRLEAAGPEPDHGRSTQPAFEARGVIDAFADFERQLAGPHGNT